MEATIRNSREVVCCVRVAESWEDFITWHLDLAMFHLYQFCKIAENMDKDIKDVLKVRVDN